jgi:hypothetical protein
LIDGISQPVEYTVTNALMSSDFILRKITKSLIFYGLHSQSAYVKFKTKFENWRRERDSQYIFNILLFPKKQKIVFYKYRAKYRQVSSAAPAVLRTIGTV